MLTSLKANRKDIISFPQKANLKGQVDMQVKIPLAKPEIIDTLTSWTPLSYKFNKAVDSLFWWCVELLKVWGDVTGLV